MFVSDTPKKPRGRLTILGVGHDGWTAADVVSDRRTSPATFPATARKGPLGALSSESRASCSAIAN